jgi:hypothetical protein
VVAAERIVAVEGEGSAGGLEQAAAEGLLEQAQALDSFDFGNQRRAEVEGRPGLFDVADAFDDESGVSVVRAAVEGEADAPRGRVVAGEQQAVAAEIVETDAIAPEGGEQQAESGFGEELAGQQVVALQAGLEAGIGVPVNRAEADALGRRAGAAGGGVNRTGKGRGAMHRRDSARRLASSL